MTRTGNQKSSLIRLGIKVQPTPGSFIEMNCVAPEVIVVPESSTPCSNPEFPLLIRSMVLETIRSGIARVKRKTAPAIRPIMLGLFALLILTETQKLTQLRMTGSQIRSLLSADPGSRFPIFASLSYPFFFSIFIMKG